MVHKPFQTTGIENRVRSFPMACLITEKIEYDDRSSITAGNDRRDLAKSTDMNFNLEENFTENTTDQ